MTKRPTDESNVVVIDAMDESEWEKDRHTPVASDEELRVLVRQSSDKSAPVAVPTAVKPQTTAATVKRTPTPVPTPKTPTPVPMTKTPTPMPKPPPMPAAAKPPAPVAVQKPAPIKRPVRPAAAPPSAVIPPKKDASAPIKRTDSVITAVGDASGAIKPAVRPAPAVAGSDPLAGVRAISEGQQSASGASATRDVLATVRALTDEPSAAAKAANEGLADGSGSLPPAARRLPLPAPRTPRPTGTPPAATPPVAQPAPGEDAATILSPPLAVDDFIGGASDPALLAIPIEPTNEVPPQRPPSKARVTHAAPVEPSYPKASRDDLRSARGDASEAKVVVGAADSGPNRRLDTASLGRGRDPSDADIELAGAHPVVGTSPVREAVAGFAKNKRNLAIAAGAVAVLIVLVVVMMSGGSKKSPSKGNHVAKTEPAKKPTPGETETPTESGSAETATGGAGTATPTGTETPTEAPPAETPTEHASEHHRKKPTLAGKQVVLEYDNQARDAKPVADAPKDDQAAIGKARNAYASGNTRLFAGDADGAITNYKQALAYYPAYVAGYRGLGLAYAQKGDKAAATKALRTYLNAVPNAKDAGLIRKRIQSLK